MKVLSKETNIKEFHQVGAKVPRIIHSPESSQDLRSIENVPFITAYDLIDNKPLTKNTKTIAAIAASLAVALDLRKESKSHWKSAALIDGVSQRVPASGENTALFSSRVQTLK